MTALSRKGRITLLSILLGGFVVATFLPVIFNGFVNYDDPDYVTSNPRVRQGLTRQNFSWAFCTDHAANWHPVTWLSHMADVEVFGLRPWGHHLVSVSLHAVATVFLFLSFWKLTGATGRSFVLAALFGLHPLRVESVAWICERKDVLAALFWMLALWFYALWRERARENKRSSFVWYALSLIAFAFGLMSKSMLVTLPFVLLLLDYWPLGRWSSANRFRLVIEKAPFFVLSFAGAAITLLVQRTAGAVKPMASYPLAARLENAAVSYCRYLGKFFWPTELAVFYPHPVYWPGLIVLFAVCLLIAISLIAIRLRHSHPWIFTGWFWYLGACVPVIGFVQVGAQSMADRYTYIPLVGVTMALVWQIFDLARDRQWNRRTATVAAALAFPVCPLLTVRQIGFWRNSETLFRHVIAVTEKNPVAHMNLGVSLMDQARNEEGLAELTKAAELAPRYAEAHLTLGTALEKVARYDESISELDETIRLNPDSAKAYLEAGVVFDKMGRWVEAGALFQQAIKRKPDFPEAHANFGVVLEQKGEIDRALAEYSEALRLDPDYVEAHQNLGSLYFKAGRIDEARAHFQRAVELRPDSAVAHNNIAGALFLQGHVDDAIAEYGVALKLKPDYGEAKANLDEARRAKASTVTR